MAGPLESFLRAEFGAAFDDLRTSLPTRPDGPNGPFMTRDVSIIRHLAWHHTAGAKDAPWKDVAEGHIDRDFAGIGYHFGIQGGRLAYLGDITTSRANVAEYNPWVIGICIAGNYTRSAPSAADLDIARHLVAVLDRFLGRELPNEPHSKWVATACPGDAVRQHLGSLRAIQPPHAPPADRPLGSVVLAAADAAQEIRLNPGSALQRAIAGAGMVPTSNEFEVTHGGARYVCQRAESLTTGKVRVYLVKAGDWANVGSVDRP